MKIFLKIFLMTRLLRGLVKPFFGPPWPYAMQRAWLRFLLTTTGVSGAAHVAVIHMAGLPAEKIAPGESRSRQGQGEPHGGGLDRIERDRSERGRSERDKTVVLYLHGGAFCTCGARTHRALTTTMAATLDAVLYVPDYRLAPEHPFPSALHDGVDAYRWLLDQGYDPAQIVLSGDSSGGGLALSVALRIKALGLPRPAALLLLSPWVDLTLAAMHSGYPHAGDPLLRWRTLQAGATAYLAGTAPAHPQASPLYADLSGLPPLLIQVGSEEILLSDAQRLAARARRYGVDTQFQVHAGGWHVFPLQVGRLPLADRAVAEMALFIKQVRTNNRPSQYARYASAAYHPSPPRTLSPAYSPSSRSSYGVAQMAGPGVAGGRSNWSMMG